MFNFFKEHRNKKRIAFLQEEIRKEQSYLEKIEIMAKDYNIWVNPKVFVATINAINKLEKELSELE